MCRGYRLRHLRLWSAEFVKLLLCPAYAHVFWRVWREELGRAIPAEKRIGDGTTFRHSVEQTWLEGRS